MAATEPAQQRFDDLAVWRTSLPGIQHALLPPSSDRPNPKLGDGMLFVSVFSPGYVYALDAATGEVCWRRELPYLGGSSVQFAKSILLAKTARTLYALAPASGSILWEFCPYGPEGETLYSEPILDGSRLFIGDRRGWLHCLNVETGETIWKQQASDGPNRNVNATAVVVAGLVITGTNAGLALAYSIEDGRPVWQAKLDGPCVQHLFLVGKQVVAAAESLHFFDPITGESQGRVNWPGFGVSFAAGTPLNIVLFTRSLLAGWETGEPMERESETLFVFEGTRLVREMRCSGYTHEVRYSTATGLLYASGLRGLDILNPETGEWLHTLRSAETTSGCGLPDVAESGIYTMNGKGVVCALQHPHVWP
jgi:hypothetical protein